MISEPKRILVFDPQIAGISGDMVVGALLALGADALKVMEAMRIPGHCLQECKDLEIAVTDTTRRGIRAKRIEVKSDEEHIQRTGAELLEAAYKCLQMVQISERARRFALNSINTLISAEATAHGESIAEVVLHETASADTLADVIGSATALDDLELFADTAIYSTPVAVGGGMLQFSHGMVSSPAPATLEILRSRGLLTVGGPVEAELATPTGVSILSALGVESVRFYPPMRPIKVGYGAGTREFGEMPNVLRITLGEPCDFGLSSEQAYVIETNVDDVSGETIGYVMQKLLQEGARDVSTIATLAKKGRPGHLIKVMADRTSLERLCRILIDETGTLGVRIYPCERRVLARESVPVEVQIEGVTEVVQVKVAKDRQGQIVHIKPEYDDIKRLAEQTGKPLEEIAELVRRKFSVVL